MKARTQITAAATAVVALLVALSGQFIVWRVDHDERATLDHALQQRAAQIRTTATKSGSLVADGTYVVRLMSGTTVRAQVGSKTEFSGTVTDGYSTIKAADGSEWRSWAETLKTGVQLQVLVSLADIQAHHGDAVRIVDLAVLVAILLGALASWFAAGVVLRPLRRLETGARELDPADPEARLPMVREPREAAELAVAINALLDRLHAVEPATPAPSGPPVIATPARSTITAPDPALAPTPIPPLNLPPSPPALEADTRELPTVAAPAPPAGVAAADLQGPLTRLGEELDNLLDNPEMPSFQRHLVLAGIQSEYRMILELVDAQTAPPQR